MVKTQGVVGERRIFVVQRLQQDRNQRGLPVMAMQNVGRSEDLCGLQNGARKQSEALGVIVIVAQGGAVKSVAVEERRVVDEIELHSGALAAVEHGAEAVAIVEGHRDAGDNRSWIFELSLAVAGKKDRDLVTEIGQRRRQRSNDIREAAGLGKRHALGCRESDMHEPPSAAVNTPAWVAKLVTELR